MSRNWFWVFWAFVLIVLSGLQFTAAARGTTVYQTASNAYLTREQIRQMPLLERPNRPGHFYGNTVRRIHGRRVGRGTYRGR